MRRKRELMPQDRSPMLRRLLLSNYRNLKSSERWALHQVLDANPVLHQIHAAKEALHKLYRIRVPKLAHKALTRLCDALALSELPELKTLRRTLMKWRAEVLQYFSTTDIEASITIVFDF